MTAGEECGLDSGRFRDLSRTDASGANLQVFWSAVDHRPDALEVRQPAPLADIVGMRYLASAHWALAADFTSLRPSRRALLYQKTALKGGISLLKDAVSRSIYRHLLRELTLQLGGRRMVMNITFWCHGRD